MSEKISTIDRRKSVLVREAVTPVLVAVVVGIGSSLLTTYVAVSNLQLKVQYMEKNIDTLATLVQNINQSAIRVERLEFWQESQTKRTERLENRIDKLESVK